MKCDKQCSYRTPYGYCSVTQCQTNLGTTYAEPRHFKKDMSEEYVWRINDNGTDAKIQKIIRCKDCKYCDRHHLVDGLFCYRLYEKYNKEYPQMIIEVDADDFCSRGKRR